jgi:DNA polymerase III subunit epsilon
MQNFGPDCKSELSIKQNVSDSFVALDVETANPTISSICQIATVTFVDGEIVDVWHTLVDPGEPFASWNVKLHGINAVTVNNAPDFASVMLRLSATVSGKVVASHTAFDRVSLHHACLKSQIPNLSCSWIDTARVARRAWPRFRKRGYGLKSVAEWHGISFRHHDAIEDARVAGLILSQAVLETGMSLEQWLAELSPIDRKRQPKTQPQSRFRHRFASSLARIRSDSGDN